MNNKITASAPKNPPVEAHGQLSVNGANIIDKNGDAFQLKGMSTHGLQWYPQYVDKKGFQSFRDDWGVNCIRLAMYVEEGGYMSDKDKLEKEVREGIDYCVDLGIYVIVDWHILSDGNPNTHKSDAIEFFKKIAADYNTVPNIIYEICNEPNGNVSWDNDIKPYCEDVTEEIRKLDGEALIIAGTPTLSQDIDKAEANRLTDKNTVYTLHFYAATHTQWLRDRLTACADKGLPVMVSEFGTCDASGTGGNNLTETESWLKLLDKNKIGYINWNISDKNESAACFKPGTSASGGWKESDFSEGAGFVLKWIKSN
jgi:endoglucanase